jgi:tetratricopeptide (TPR) repeat protein
MKKFAEQKKKRRLGPLKDIDSVARSQFLRLFAWLFAPLCVLGFWGSGLKGIMLAFVFSLVVSPLIMLILEKFGRSTASFLYGGGYGSWSKRDQLRGDLNTVKHHKMRKEYDQALEVVNRILKIDPDFSEAIFLKAQILWEGFENTAASKGYLKQIIETKKDKDETIHRWASTLYDELTAIEKEKKPPLQ